MQSITAGAYLRLRREAAGLSIDDVATMIGEDLPDRMRWREWLDLIEHDLMPATPNMVRVLRGVFRFDHYIHGQIAAGLAPPSLCRTCACSWADPCDDEETGSCAWAEADLCTACADRAATATSRVLQA